MHILNCKTSSRIALPTAIPQLLLFLMARPFETMAMAVTALRKKRFISFLSNGLKAVEECGIMVRCFG